MGKSFNMLIAGFGGQGVLFAGKVISYAGLLDGSEVSWLPSYGPEMRGGTASVSVCISDSTIGSPQVNTPDVFVAMNLPSYKRFINDCVPNATVIIDSSLVNEKVERDDINVFYVPATQLAQEHGLKGLANIILVGKLLKETGFTSHESLVLAIKKSVPAKKAEMLESNLKAIELGMGL